LNGVVLLLWRYMRLIYILSAKIPAHVDRLLGIVVERVKLTGSSRLTLVVFNRLSSTAHVNHF